MNVHKELDEAFALVRRPKQPQTARLVDVASGQVAREYVLDGLSPDEQNAWYFELTRQWDLAVRFRIEFSDHFEERDV